MTQVRLGRFRCDVAVDTSEAGARTQMVLREFARSRLAQVLQSCATDIAGGSDVRLDRVVVDLGAVPLQQIAGQAEAALRERVTVAILRQVLRQRATPDQCPQGGNSGVRSPSDTQATGDLDVVARMLETGQAHWRGGRADLETHLRHAIDRHPAALREMLLKLARQSDVRQRLVWQTGADLRDRLQREFGLEVRAGEAGADARLLAVAADAAGVESEVTANAESEGTDDPAAGRVGTGDDILPVAKSGFPDGTTGNRGDPADDDTLFGAAIPAEEDVQVGTGPGKGGSDDPAAGRVGTGDDILPVAKSGFPDGTTGNGGDPADNDTLFGAAIPAEEDVQVGTGPGKGGSPSGEPVGLTREANIHRAVSRAHGGTGDENGFARTGEQTGAPVGDRVQGAGDPAEFPPEAGNLGTSGDEAGKIVSTGAGRALPGRPVDPYRGETRRRPFEPGSDARADGRMRQETAETAGAGARGGRATGIAMPEPGSPGQETVREVETPLSGARPDHRAEGALLPHEAEVRRLVAALVQGVLSMEQAGGLSALDMAREFQGLMTVQSSAVWRWVLDSSDPQAAVARLLVNVPSQSVALLLPVAVPGFGGVLQKLVEVAAHSDPVAGERVVAHALYRAARGGFSGSAGEALNDCLTAMAAEPESNGTGRRRSDRVAALIAQARQQARSDPVRAEAFAVLADMLGALGTKQPEAAAPVGNPVETTRPDDLMRYLRYGGSSLSEARLTRRLIASLRAGSSAAGRYIELARVSPVSRHRMARLLDNPDGLRALLPALGRGAATDIRDDRFGRLLALLAGQRGVPAAAAVNGVDAAAQPQATVPADPARDRLIVETAGAVLLWPFLQLYFQRCGLWMDRHFRDEAARRRAALLLYALTTGKPNAAEHQVPLEKVLCGLPLTAPVEASITRTPVEVEQGEDLLREVCRQWTPLAASDVAALRETFLLRPGVLGRLDGEGPLVLQVQEGAFDMLLNRLPWNKSLIRLPWMREALHVSWD